MGTLYRTGIIPLNVCTWNINKISQMPVCLSNNTRFETILVYYSATQTGPKFGFCLKAIFCVEKQSIY